MTIQRIGVLGAGAWGTTLAIVARRAGRNVVLWARREEQVRALSSERENKLHLPGIKIDPAITLTNDIDAALKTDAVLVALPAQHVREHLVPLAWPAGVPAVICAKGIERGSLLSMPEVMEAIQPRAPLAMLSGPTFAGEVARGKPGAIVIAARDMGLAENLAGAIATPEFRPYASDDLGVVGPGGAVRMVRATSWGIVVGRGFGGNARAELVTRGLAELARLVDAAGGKRETAMGLSGAGDLILTATSLQSRNTSLGESLGRGRTLTEILAQRRSVAEGVESAAAVVALAAKHGVEMPISESVAAILAGGSIDEELRRLLARPLKREREAES